MKLSDFGTLITLGDYFALPDKDIISYIKEITGKQYSVSALTNFRKKNKIHKNTKKESLVIRYGEKDKKLRGVDLLLTTHRGDLNYIIEKNLSSRRAVKWLQENKKCFVSKNSVLRAKRKICY